VYFERAIAILRARGVDPVVKAEFIAKCLSDGWKWALFTGIDEALPLMQRLRIKVRAMQEGTLFRPYEPVMEIEGRYQDFCVYETALLGLLCQASGVATKAARIKKLAGDRVVMNSAPAGPWPSGASGRAANGSSPARGAANGRWSRTITSGATAPAAGRSTICCFRRWTVDSS